VNLAKLFRAEVVREFTLLFRYPLETVSRLIWNLGFALLIFYGFEAVVGPGAGSLPGFEEGNKGRLLGLLTTSIAMNGINNAAELLSEEVQTGTLEQAALSPPPLTVVVLLRDFASYAEMLVRFGLVLFIASAITGVRFHWDLPAIALLLTLMYLGTEGIGLALGGAALLYKRIATLSQFAIMLVFGLAMFPLEAVPGWGKGFVHNFPFTKALLVLRDVAVKGVPLADIASSGQLAALAVNTAAYLFLGVAVFSWAERKARDWGTLNQY
jgi:ABC-2 type transport system permease protein